MITRLYKPNEIAVVSTQPAFGQPGSLLLSVARGKSAKKLSQGTTYGPYPESEIQAPFDQLVTQLRNEGFVASGLGFQLAALADSSAKVRAKAAARVGWLRSHEAVDALLAAASKGSSDICAITDALGMIGDARAVPMLRTQAARKLLSRRRSGVEALRNLGDAEGLAEAMVRARERLDEKVLGALTLGDANDASAAAIEPLVKAVLSLPVKERGLTLDTLYEIATPASIAAARTVLAQIAIGKPHIWRYTKSIFKRAQLRHDYRTFGWLAHAIEREARTDHGTVATVKSGLDGESRETPIFKKKTQDYVRRAAWRFLRTLARRRPEAYPYAAALAVIPYVPTDIGDPAKKYDEFANLYVLHRILWGGSQRFKIDGRTMRFQYLNSKAALVPGGVREEAFPTLWDQAPRAYVQILAEAGLREAHGFALAAVARNPGILSLASDEELVEFLDAPHEKTVELGLTELDRRFDARNPNWKLLERLLADEKPAPLGIGLRWLKLSASLWTRDLERMFAFLGSPNPRVRSLAVELSLAALPGVDAALRKALAAKILEGVRAPEKTPGTHEGYSQVGREALVAELLPLVSVHDLLQLIANGSLPAQGLAGVLLQHHEGALSELGVNGILPLSEHEVILVRATAVALVKRALPSLGNDPSLLFLLAESEWPDVRAAAIGMLEHDFDLSSLGLDGLVGLCDSSRVEVQNLGRTLVLRHFATLDPNELLFRLAQHPHANMRRFALELIEQHLKEGFVQLSRLEIFFRAALFQLWPDRDVKDRVIDFLGARGLRDENQAGVAAGILNDFVRSQTQVDFERAAEALVKIKIAHPTVETAVQVAVSA